MNLEYLKAILVSEDKNSTNLYADLFVDSIDEKKQEDLMIVFHFAIPARIDNIIMEKINCLRIKYFDLTDQDFKNSANRLGLKTIETILVNSKTLNDRNTTVRGFMEDMVKNGNR